MPPPHPSDSYACVKHLCALAKKTDNWVAERRFNNSFFSATQGLDFFSIQTEDSKEKNQVPSCTTC